MLRLIDPLLADPERYGAAMDPKTSLQELASRTGATPPVYDVESTRARSRAAVHRDRDGRRTVSAEGVGTSKKQAEMAAALLAWRELSGRA